MNPIKSLMYFMLVNGMLALFTTISSYSISASVFSGASALQAIGWQLDLSSSSIITVFGISFGGLALGGIVGYASGINPLTGATFGAMCGFFFTAFINVFSVMNNIANSMGAYSPIMWTFIGIIGTVYVVSLLYTLVQMVTGGHEGYE